MDKVEKCRQGLPAGTVLKSGKESYRVVSVLGAGGFGITYKVERLADGVTLAMKEFFPDMLCERAADGTITFLASNSEAVRTGINNFTTEATRLLDRKISHPNLVEIVEVFKANNTAYYTMEFIDGCDLRQYVKRTGDKPLSAAQTLSVVRPILQVLDLIHSHNLTHLDIKHENILLTWESDRSLRPVLIDFGLAKHYDRKGNATSHLSNAGCSEGFSPPEQYQGLTKFTPQADIYALSATMLYLLTATWPDKEMSATEITARFDKVDPDGTKIPRRVRDAVINGMRRDKDVRTQSAAALAAALGLEIASHTHEGNVTRLLSLGDNGKKPSLPKVEWKRILRPGAYLAAAALTGGIIYWAANRPAPTPSEQLTEAIGNQNYDQIKYFAELDSARAFLPYARMLLDSADYNTALNYASLRLGTQDHEEAEKLIDLIKTIQNEEETITAIPADDSATSVEPLIPQPVAETQTREEPKTHPKPEESRTVVENGPSNDELFAKASSIADYRALADKGYAKAYAPLAEKYFYARKYWDADHWVRRALSAGVGTSQARRVADKLEILGMYHNGENGGKPE